MLAREKLLKHVQHMVNLGIASFIGMKIGRSRAELIVVG
jgi:hypothetical protein